MSIKILTKNSTENTNIDGARANHFNAGMRNGIVRGAYNEGDFFASSSNTICLDTCELRISGHQIIVESPEYITFTNAPASAIRYSLVARLVVDDNGNPEFNFVIYDSQKTLIEENLYATNNGSGTYELEIGRFTLNTDITIDDVVRTVDVITGGSSNGSSLNIGEITTEVLDPSLKAEVNIENRKDETTGEIVTDFYFGIPQYAKFVLIGTDLTIIVDESQITNS